MLQVRGSKEFCLQSQQGKAEIEGHCQLCYY